MSESEYYQHKSLLTEWLLPPVAGHRWSLEAVFALLYEDQGRGLVGKPSPPLKNLAFGLEYQNGDWTIHFIAFSSSPLRWNLAVPPTQEAGRALSSVVLPV